MFVCVCVCVCVQAGVVVCVYLCVYHTHCSHLTVHNIFPIIWILLCCTEPVFPSEPLLKGFTRVTEQNEPPVDEHAIQDSPPSSDALGETQDGDSLPQYQPKTLPVAPPPTPPTTLPHSECIK